jgi:hypothetical protein
MMSNLDCFARILGAESQADCTCCAISLEEAVIVPSRFRQKAQVSGVASLWRSSVKSSCAPARGTPNHAPRDRPVLMRWISMLTFSLEMIRKKGNEATAAITGAPARSAWSQSSADYVALGVRGDPRGR